MGQLRTQGGRQWQTIRRFGLFFSVFAIGVIALLGFTTASYATDVTGVITGTGGKCLDNHWGQLKNENYIQLWDCNATGAQQWTITSSGAIKNRSSDYCLDVKYGGTSDETPVWLYNCNGTAAQAWKQGPNGSIVNPQSGKCLDNRYGATTNGNPIIIYGCNGTPAQNWQLPAGSKLPRAAALEAPSGEAMPVGDLSGWKQTLAEDFTVDSPAGSFEEAYKSVWCGYDQNVQYHNARTISTHDGVMDFTLDGKVGGAGYFDSPAGSCDGQLYGRFAMRIKAVNAADNGTAIMVWPVSDIWGDGEIDYPEGNFDETLGLFHHPMGCVDCSASDSLDTGASWQVWRTVAIEWEPSAVRYYLDGKLIKTVTHDIPNTKHRYTIQMAPNGSHPQPGNFLIDWVTMYSRS